MLIALEDDAKRAFAIAKTIYQLAIAGELPEEHFGFESYGLHDDFRLGRFREGFENLRSYLREYSSVSSPEGGM